jgi:hypothetical protein
MILRRSSCVCSALLHETTYSVPDKRSPRKRNPLICNENKASSTITRVTSRKAVSNLCGAVRLRFSKAQGREDDYVAGVCNVNYRMVLKSRVQGEELLPALV